MRHEPAPYQSSQTDESWMVDAACKGVDVTIFFSQDGGTYDQVAIDLCAGCKVRNQCLAWVLDLPWWEGYIAGTTMRQRDAMRYNRRRGISIWAKRNP